MLPAIEITLQNGQLGQTIPTDDGLTGLLLQGPAATGLAQLTPKLITTLEEAEALGIDADYDTANSVKVYRVIKEFYAQGGNGLRLWIMIVPQAVLVATMMDKAEADYAVKLLNAAQGGIRMLGVVKSPAAGYVADVTANHIDIDIVNAFVNAQALAVEYQNKIQPVRIVLEGYAFDGDAGALLDLKTLTHRNVAVLIGNTETGANAAMGILLGRLASNPVMRNPGRVKSDALTLNDIFIGTAAFADAMGLIESVHNKGYITFRQHNGKGGYYFTDDPTATSATDDYNSFARGRVIDKCIVLAYGVFVDEILEEIKVNDQGHIETAKAKYYQGIVDNQINNAMVANDELSGFSSYVDAEQDVITSGKVCIELRPRPVGYLKDLQIKLGFEV